jgi:hypothetical protein
MKASDLYAASAQIECLSINQMPNAMHEDFRGLLSSSQAKVIMPIMLSLLLGFYYLFLE